MTAETPLPDGARRDPDTGEWLIDYTITLRSSHTNPARATKDLDLFLWRGLYRSFRDRPTVHRGSTHIAYDSYGDDMGHHEGHDHAITTNPQETP